MECVNCRTKYNIVKYNFNQTCIDLIPEGYHIVNEIYNKICKISCIECNDNYNPNKCTKCSYDYYKEDFFEIVQPNSFYCFNESQCQGRIKSDIGGVPILEENIKICLNCGLRNNSYKLEGRDYCGKKYENTYIENLYYNSLKRCDSRCKTCFGPGNHNCLSCQNYIKNNYFVGNSTCEYCKGAPFYHDYDLAEK